MSRWFRFHTEALNDPKVQRLDGETFKGWVNLLCLAAQNDGKLPCFGDIAFAIRETENAARTLVERLVNAGLIDTLNGGRNGVTYAPHGWQERQYKSDTSTDRVKRFRQRSKTVTVTPPDTETETEVSVTKVTDASVDSDKAFWDSAKAYLGKPKSGMIGKWVRDYGKPETARAITAAQLERAVDPIPYIERVLRKGKSEGWEMPVC